MLKKQFLWWGVISCFSFGVSALPVQAAPVINFYQAPTPPPAKIVKKATTDLTITTTKVEALIDLANRYQVSLAQLAQDNHVAPDCHIQSQQQVYIRHPYQPKDAAANQTYLRHYQQQHAAPVKPRSTPQAQPVVKQSTQQVLTSLTQPQVPLQAAALTQAPPPAPAKETEETENSATTADSDSVANTNDVSADTVPADVVSTATVKVSFYDPAVLGSDMGYDGIAANLNIYPKGTRVRITTAQGDVWERTVNDTGAFVYSNPNQIDVAMPTAQIPAYGITTATIQVLN